MIEHEECPAHEQLMLECEANQKLIERLTRPGERFISNNYYYSDRTTREQFEARLRLEYCAFKNLRFDYDTVVICGRGATGKEAAIIAGTGEETEWVAVYGQEKSRLRRRVELSLDQYLRHIAPRSHFH